MGRLCCRSAGVVSRYYGKIVVHLLLLAQWYPPSVGGEEQHVQNLSITPAERGHDVAVATFWQKGLFEIDREVRMYRIRNIIRRAAWLFAGLERRHVPPCPSPELALTFRRIKVIYKSYV